MCQYPYLFTVYTLGKSINVIASIKENVQTNRPICSETFVQVALNQSILRPQWGILCTLTIDLARGMDFPPIPLSLPDFDAII